MITSFGESHGRCIGIVIDGCPAGLAITEKDIQIELDKRKPGDMISSTKRAEEDKVDILSGIFNGYTTGAPICLAVWNEDAKSESYEKTKDLMRPGHADYTAFMKYGGFNDYRGGGRFSGRNTAGFVMAGAVAQKLLDLTGVKILAHTVEIGGMRADSYDVISAEVVNNNPLNCADLRDAAKRCWRPLKKRARQGTVWGVSSKVSPSMCRRVWASRFSIRWKAIWRRRYLRFRQLRAWNSAPGLRWRKMKGSENNDAFPHQTR